MATATQSSVLARFGHALSDPTRTRILLTLADAPTHPADLADLIGVSRSSLSNHLACLRGCGLVVAVPVGRRLRYELADPRIAHALRDLLTLVLVTDPDGVPGRRDGRLLMVVPLQLSTRPTDGARRAVLTRRVQLLVAATITYNLIEAGVALAAGAAASSTALTGFGLDSVIEVSSAAAVAWQFSGSNPEARERRTLRIIGCSFFALSAYVTLEALRSLTGDGESHPSTVGIVLAALSVAIMPGLSWLQRRTGNELGSRTAVADSKQTLLCTYMSAALLFGLLLNSLAGWSWADPVVALVIAGLALREGLNAWRGESCCAVPAAGVRPPGRGQAESCCTHEPDGCRCP